MNGQEFRQRLAGLLGRKRRQEEKIQKKPPVRETNKPEPKREA